MTGETKPRRLFVALAALVVASLAFTAGADPTTAEAAAGLYAGKTIRIIVGDSSGGGFDASGRILEQLLPDLLPGHPDVIVQNMPGGSSLLAANYLYNVAPADGTYLGIFNHSLILQTMADPGSTKFDMSKFQWIGRVAIDDLVGIVWAGSGVRSLDDAKTREVTIGANSGNSSSAMVPYALNHLLGTRFKVVTGYPGLVERYLAMERGEIDGISGASWRAITKNRPDWIAQHKIIVLHQNFLQRESALADVPTLLELGKTQADRDILGLLCLDETVGKSVAFGPNVPKVYVDAVRKAFDEAAAEPAFTQAADRMSIIPAPMKGSDLQSFFTHEAAVITPDFVTRFDKVTAP
jgi:tripartite-type tricarboxylate transporter receptor subunit TctC